MPENKQEIKKLVKEELKKKGVEAPDEVVEQLSEVAGSDLEGVGGGMSAAGRVILTVGGALAAAGAGALVMWGGEKAYDKYKGNKKFGPNDKLTIITKKKVNADPKAEPPVLAQE